MADPPPKVPNPIKLPREARKELQKAVMLCHPLVCVV